MSYRPTHYAAALLLVQTLAGCSEPPANNVTAASADMGRTGASASDTPAEPGTQDAGPLVVAFGDSLYAGYGIAARESFPAELQRALRARGIAATVHNAGVSGDTSAAGLRRLAFTLDGLERKPDLVLVGLGGNDMLRGIDPAETRANLTAIADELRRRDIRFMLTGMVAAPNMGADFARRFNAIYPELAARHGVALDPFFLQDVVTRPALMLPDRVHPKPEGIDLIVDRVAPLVAQQLAATAPPLTPR